MPDAYKDENGVSTLIAGLNTDGKTIVRVLADPTAHTLNAADGDTGSDHGPENALKDQNMVSSLIAVSSADGKTPVVVYADADGNLLIQTT